MDINFEDKENVMKVRRQISANARRKHLKVQHHKVNIRRQFYYNQVVNQTVNQENSVQSQEH